MYEQAVRRKLIHDTIRHGRFVVIVEQREYSLNKRGVKDALLSIPDFGCSVQDTMTALHFKHLFEVNYLKKKLEILTI